MSQEITNLYIISPSLTEHGLYSLLTEDGETLATNGFHSRLDAVTGIDSEVRDRLRERFGSYIKMFFEDQDKISITQMIEANLKWYKEHRLVPVKRCPDLNQIPQYQNQSHPAWNNDLLEAIKYRKPIS